MATKNGGGPGGWWSDSETVDPVYLTPDAGQQGQDLDFYYAGSKEGYASGAYPNGTPVPCEVDND